MNLVDFTKVQALYQQRSDVLHRIAVVEAKGHDLTRHFNVHIHGTAQDASIAEIAAVALRSHFRTQLVEIDKQLTALGVSITGMGSGSTDPLASLRPENFAVKPGTFPTGVMETDQAGDNPEVLAAVLTLVKAAFDNGGLGRVWNARDLTASAEGGESVKIGNYQVTAKKVD